jgi:hypothetical protein
MLLASGLALLSPGGVAPESPDPGANDLTLTAHNIWSYYTETPPSLDDPTDSIWDYPLEVLGLVPGHVALSGGTSLEIRSLYTETDVYFRIIWHDVVENSQAPRWVYHNGNWTFTSPFEDGLGLYFPITDPEGLFLDEGCMRTCHMTDWENPQNQERKFTYTEEETGDLWFWSSGISNPWDFAIDAYVIDRPSGNNVGYYEDPEMDLGLIKNRHLTEYMEYVYLSRPVYMQDPNLDPLFGPAFIAKGEEITFDQNYYDPDLGDPGLNPLTHEPWQNGDIVGGYILDHLPERGQGQIDAKGSYDIQNQQWSLLMKRPLDTGDPVHDVIFDDLTATYQFGISLFGDIMGGGDTSEPFVEPDGGDRCVMNKVTNTIGLRFRPVLETVRSAPLAPASWDGDRWDAEANVLRQELIHRSGEIHDPWDWLNVSTACDGDDIYLYLRQEDPNASEEYKVEAAWLTPGMVSVEETFHLLEWSDMRKHIVTEEGTADIWTWGWNASGPSEGNASDMVVEEGVVRSDSTGPDDIESRTWRADGSRHIVLSHPLDSGDPDDVAFHDMARTYVLRLALYSEDRGEWYVTYPVTLGFEPDPADTIPCPPVSGVTATDGGDSDILLEWDPSTEGDFGQYRVYLSSEDFDTLEGLTPDARISDMGVDGMHLRGIMPDQDYHVAVVAVDDNRNLPPSIDTLDVRVTDDTSPAPLASVKAFDNLDSDLLISWDPGEEPDIVEYDVYIEEASFDSASGLAPVATVRGQRVSSWRVGGLDPGVTYHAAVVAVDWAGNADRRVASVSGSPTDVTAPPEVRGIDASTPQAPESEGEVLLKWRDVSSEDVSHYNVYLSLTPIESLQNYAPVDQVDPGKEAVTVVDLNPGVEYHLAVTAVDRTGHEGPSKFTVSAIASTAEPPAQVTGLTAVQSGATSVRVSWLPVNVTGSPLVAYRVLMSTEPMVDPEGPDVILVDNVTPSSEPSLLVTELEPGTTYYFAVEVVDSKGHTGEGSMQVASLTIPVPKKEEPGLWEVVGPPLTIVLLIVIIALAAYVAVSRQRRYGRLLKRRPGRSKGRNGGNSV